MPDKVFLRGPDNTITPLQPRPFMSESELDDTIENAPALLASALSTPDRELNFLFLERQASIDDEQGERAGRWSADLLFLDNEGVLTVVEDKLSNNHEIRRKVMGQAIEYAANISAAWTADHAKRSLDNQHGDANEVIAEAFRLEQAEVQDFWVRVSNNIRAGAVRLVFAADSLPRELKLSIEFLNQVTNPLEVAGVEVKQLHAGEDSDMNVLVASSVGLSERKTKQRAGSSTPMRTESSRAEFLQALNQFAPTCEYGPATLDLTNRLLRQESLLEPDFYTTGKGTQTRCRFHRRTDGLCLLAVSAAFHRKTIVIAAPARRDKWPDALQVSFRDEVGFPLDDNSLNHMGNWIAEDPSRTERVYAWVVKYAAPPITHDGEPG